MSRVIEHAEHTALRSAGRVRKWAWILEAGKYLRVILLEDGEMVPNAFFDGSYKKKSL